MLLRIMEREGLPSRMMEREGLPPFSLSLCLIVSTVSEGSNLHATGGASPSCYENVHRSDKLV